MKLAENSLYIWGEKKSSLRHFYCFSSIQASNLVINDCKYKVRTFKRKWDCKIR